ncbi:hypothetical protein AbraIFM66950_003921 [Aspergillus brasiliensis]|nr:hypothetical protein AbraIFM66950_003921 [Aspergillus brasiliensis]
MANQIAPIRLRWWRPSDIPIIYHRMWVTARYGLPKGLPPHAKGTININSRDPERRILVNLYYDQEISGAAPVIIHLSGRGFCIPSHGVDDTFLDYVANNDSAFVVIDVSYRLAPENPFPAALEDVEDVVAYLTGHPQEFDLSHFAICGFGIGGNLALAMAINSPRNTFTTVVAFYPVVDMSISERDKIKNLDRIVRKKMRMGTGGVIPLALMEGNRKRYLRGHPETIVNDSRVSPGRENDLTRFPRRCFFVTCEGDPWAQETRTLLGRLRQARPQSTTLRGIQIPNVGHAWDKCKKLDAHGAAHKHSAYTEAARFLRREIDP